MARRRLMAGRVTVGWRKAGHDTCARDAFHCRLPVHRVHITHWPANPFSGVTVIDSEGFRPNVGIIVCNGDGQVLWARRRGHDAWQFPQGGISGGESPEEAMYRELHEEVGLREPDVRILARTQGWLRYHLPERYIRQRENPRCIGQKQKWFLLRLVSDDERVRVDAHVTPEFDQWRWVSYWYPLGQIVAFKREVYRRALWELSPRHGRLVRNGR